MSSMAANGGEGSLEVGVPYKRKIYCDVGPAI